MLALMTSMAASGPALKVPALSVSSLRKKEASSPATTETAAAGSRGRRRLHRAVGHRLEQLAHKRVVDGVVADRLPEQALAQAGVGVGHEAAQLAAAHPVEAGHDDDVLRLNVLEEDRAGARLARVGVDGVVQLLEESLQPLKHLSAP